MGVEEEQAKQFGVIGDLISAIKKQGADKPMSAKEEAAATKKLLDTQVEMLKLFEGGIPSDLSSGSKKAIMSAAQQAGIDVTEKQEDKSEETERFLIQLAFKAKMERLKEAKVKAKEDGDLATQAGLNMKGLWLKGTNKISEKILNLKEKISSGTDISNLTSAISSDFSMLTMQFQGLMELPGMKIIVASLKYLAAWAAKGILPIVRAFWSTWRKDFFKRRTAKESGEWQGFWSRLRGKEHEEAKKARAIKKGIVSGIQTPEEGELEKTLGIDMLKPKKSLSGLDFIPEQGTLFEDSDFKAEAEKAKEKVLDFTKISGDMFAEHKTVLTKVADFGRKILTRLGEEMETVKDFFGPIIKKFRLRAKLFGKNIKRFFTNTRNKAITRAAKIFGGAQFKFTKALQAISVAMAGFSAVIMAKVAIVLLVIVALYFLIKYIKANIEKIKVRFKQAIDKFKQVFRKVSNWFTDLGEDIVYKIKWLIAKIKDGIFSMANKIITQVNKIPFVNIEKFDEGRTDRLEGQREEDLAARIKRDQGDTSHYKALSQERGKQLEDAAKADADRKAEKDAGTTGGSQQINTSVQTDAREVYMTSESTVPSDPLAAAANQALIG